jgi:hypothetical protein
MANRHANKKLRAEILARMRETGESYQTAYARVVARARLPDAARTADLVACTRFGVPMTLITFSGGPLQWFALVGQAPPTASTRVPVAPLSSMTALRPRGVN